jgi:hypothetical protein
MRWQSVEPIYRISAAAFEQPNADYRLDQLNIHQECGYYLNYI